MGEEAVLVPDVVAAVEALGSLRPAAVDVSGVPAGQALGD